MRRPAPDETAPYYRMYIDRVPDRDVVEALRRQVEDTAAVLADLDDRGAGYRYAEGKWSIKELLGHLCDVERTFAWRALAFARCDPAPLPSFEQDRYAAHAGADHRPLADLVAELRAVRAASVCLFASFAGDGEVLARTGIASGCRFTVNAMPWIVAGHELHHRAVLRERYGLE